MFCLSNTTVASGLMISFAFASAATAQSWREPRDGACFYENRNYSGRSFCVRAGEGLQAVPGGMNDRVSSIRTFGRHAVTVYRDVSFGGPAVSFDGDVPDLRRTSWNDQISSVEVGVNRYGYGGYHDRGGYSGYKSRTSDQGYGYGMTRQRAENVVRNAYRSVLNRDPDPASEGFVEHVLRDGWSQADVERDLRRSAEYQNRIR